MTDSKTPISEAPSADRSAPSASVIGRFIGEFQVRREIGRGGMGTVYEAWQRSLNRTVALKILSGSSQMTPNVVVRFQREAQAAAKLQHSNIVRIYAQGEDAGIYYYAMEYVDGQSLHEIINELRHDPKLQRLEATDTRIVLGSGNGGGRVGSADPQATVVMPARMTTDSRAARSAAAGALQAYDLMAVLLASVADALDYAHREGVIHRDIKPHNFLYGKDGRLSLTDFGLARVLEQPGVTTTGEFLGSPLYMSPEQISGGSIRVDHRTDIYSLGAAMYEWLTLSPPFPGETREQVITRIVHAEVAPPRTIRPDVPVDLETICLKALEKDLHRRYGTAGEMADDLRRFVGRQSIRAKRLGVVARLRRIIERNRAAALAFGAVIAVFSLTWGFETRAARQHEADQQKLTEQIKTLETERKSLQLTLEERMPLESKVLESVAGAAAGVFRSLSAIQQTGETAGVAPLADVPSYPITDQDRAMLLALMDDLIDRLRRASSQPSYVAAAANPAAREARELYRQALDADTDEEAMELVDQALSKDLAYYDAVCLRAILDARMLSFADLRTEADALVGVKPELFAGYLLRGLAQLFDGSPAESLSDFGQAIARDPRVPAAYIARGAAHARLNHFIEAVTDFRVALNAVPSHPAVAREFERLNSVLEVLSLRIDEAADNADVYLARGDLNFALDRFVEAADDYEKALSLGATRTGSLIARAYTAKSRAASRPPVALREPPDPRVPVPPRPPTDQPSRTRPNLPE